MSRARALSATTLTWARRLRLVLRARGLSKEAFTAPLRAEIMGVITGRPRDYVIFCGTVFGKLLWPYIEGRQHRFHLTKADGSPTRQTYRFANLRLPYGDTEVTAGLAYSWAQQGIPMRSYAEKIRELYGSA